MLDIVSHLPATTRLLLRDIGFAQDPFQIHGTEMLRAWEGATDIGYLRRLDKSSGKKLYRYANQSGSDVMRSVRRKVATVLKTVQLQIVRTRVLLNGKKISMYHLVYL